MKLTLISLPSTCGRTVTVFERARGADTVEIDRHVGALGQRGDHRHGAGGEAAAALLLLRRSAEHVIKGAGNAKQHDGVDDVAPAPAGFHQLYDRIILRQFTALLASTGLGSQPPPSAWIEADDSLHMREARLRQSNLRLIERLLGLQHGHQIGQLAQPLFGDVEGAPRTGHHFALQAFAQRGLANAVAIRN